MHDYGAKPDCPGKFVQFEVAGGRLGYKCLTCDLRTQIVRSESEMLDTIERGSWRSLEDHVDREHVVVEGMEVCLELGRSCDVLVMDRIRL